MSPSDGSPADPQRGFNTTWLMLATPILTGLLGLIGAAIGSSLQRRANVDLERERLRSQLILKAIETGNPENAAVNLKFLVDVGLVIDTSGRLVTYIRRPDSAPALPAPAASPEQGAPSADQRSSQLSISPGSPVEVTMHLPRPARVTYRRWTSRDVVRDLGQFAAGDTTFALPYGGYIYFRADYVGSTDKDERPTDCKAGCTVTFE